jgi:hypothetical protein
MRRWRILGRLGAAIAVAAGLVGVAAPAAATVTVVTNSVKRTKDERVASKYPYWISRNDCETDNDFTFDVTLDTTTVAAGGTLSVWVSQTQNCKAQQTRRDSCTEVASVTNLEQTMSIPVAAKDIVAALGASGCDDTGTVRDAREISLYFLYSKGTDADVADKDAYLWKDTSVDLLGPEPPTNVELSVGEEMLFLKYDESPSKNDVEGYNFYCVEVSGRGGAGGGGGDGGSAGGSAGGGDCPPSALSAGQLPDPKLKCGSSTSPSGEIKKLTNFRKYAVAVASYDILDNLGELSAVQCGTPEEVTDFFEEYRAAGGRAGGGFCSIGEVLGGGVPWSLVTGGVGAAGLALGLRRLVRRRHVRPSSEAQR